MTVIASPFNAVSTTEPLPFSNAATTSAAANFPEMTWYVKIFANTFWFFFSSKEPSVSASILAKASFVGAKTVKGPAPCKALTRSAAFKAVTKVEKSLLPTATSTIVLDAILFGGVRFSYLRGVRPEQSHFLKIRQTK